MMGSGPSAEDSDAPGYVTPFITTEPVPSRLCVPAATVVSHGPGCATLPTVPALPAEAATNTPASAANRNAISTASRKLLEVPLIEKLITSTPSATAWSIAATLSEPKQPPPVGVSAQQTLYMAMRARGAMPLVLPSAAAWPVTVTPSLPPAVVDVCVPW